MIISLFTDKYQMWYYSYSMGNVCRVASVAPMGFDGHIIEVESDLTKGLPSLQVLGLASKSIDEAKERIKSALTNSLLTYPAKRMTINLAPAELPKDGTLYDLPMALALLGSSEQLLQQEVDHAIFAGELALDGRIRPIQGAIAIAECARVHQIPTVYLPKENAVQATLVDGVSIVGVSTLKELYLHLKGERKLTPETPTTLETKSTAPAMLLDNIYGQEQAKRALIIAAAGHHNILMSGPPGGGKTMLAKTLADLLPPLSSAECLEVTKLHSLAGLAIDTVVTDRPFRAPHHTASQIALIGGGTKLKPGEISLAHRGVLFLDEMPEYMRSTLESLRQPLEDGSVTVSRASGSASYPADFMLVGTMNPCPCGYFGDQTRECTCSPMQINTYQKRISGPLLDRIDLMITVSKIPNSELLSHKSLSDSQHKSAIEMITNAKKIQANRYECSTKYNNNLHSSELTRFAPLAREAKQFLDAAATKMNLSARSYFKVIKVARTIADLDGSEPITIPHLAEALQYRGQ